MRKTPYVFFVLTIAIFLRHEYRYRRRRINLTMIVQTVITTDLFPRTMSGAAPQIPKPTEQAGAPARGAPERGAPGWGARHWGRAWLPGARPVRRHLQQ